MVIRDTKKYALKSLDPCDKSDLLHELRIQHSLCHKNIVQVLEWFPFNQLICLVMELCENGTLRQLLKNRQGLTQPEVRYYGIQIAGAIKHIHDKGFIHGDVKPDNILLGRDLEAKVTDFGLTQEAGPGIRVEFPKAAYLYWPPETINGEPCGYSLDIWSYGVVIVNMLTGHFPFDIVTENNQDRLKRCYRVFRMIEPPISDLLKRIFDKDQDKRASLQDISRHQFFASGYTPLRLDISCLKVAPDWSNVSSLEGPTNAARLMEECGLVY